MWDVLLMSHAAAAQVMQYVFVSGKCLRRKLQETTLWTLSGRTESSSLRTTSSSKYYKNNEYQK